MRLRKQAENYAVEKPLRATGDAENFLRRIPEDETMKRLTLRRLYLSAMLEALAGRNKVLVDPNAGRPELWLNTQELLGSPSFEMDRAQF